MFYPGGRLTVRLQFAGAVGVPLLEQGPSSAHGERETEFPSPGLQLSRQVLRGREGGGSELAHYSVSSSDFPKAIGCRQSVDICGRPFFLFRKPSSRHPHPGSQENDRPKFKNNVCVNFLE